MTYYTYEIIQVLPESKMMEVEYRRTGKKVHRIGMPLPIQGVDLQAYIDSYAPLPNWELEDAEFILPTVGQIGQKLEPTQPTPSLESRKLLKLSELSAWRYSKETSGIQVLGNAIRTDRESQATVTGAFISLSQGLLTSINWKTSDGTWVDLDLQAMTVIAQAVTNHVQSCFNAEALIAESIKACQTEQDLASIVFPEVLV